ncbi:Cadherin-like and PC-esterase domain-containing protein 1, partial [Eudyptula minor novaehollandiae]
MVCGQVPRCRRLCRPRPFLLALVVAICLFCQTLTPLMTSSILSAVVNGIAPNKLTKTQQGRYKEVSPSNARCFLPGSNSQTVKKIDDSILQYFGSRTRRAVLYAPPAHRESDRQLCQRILAKHGYTVTVLENRRLMEDPRLEGPYHSRISPWDLLICLSSRKNDGTGCIQIEDLHRLELFQKVNLIPEIQHFLCRKEGLCQITKAFSDVQLPVVTPECPGQPGLSRASAASNMSQGGKSTDKTRTAHLRYWWKQSTSAQLNQVLASLDHKDILKAQDFSVIIKAYVLVTSLTPLRAFIHSTATVWHPPKKKHFSVKLQRFFEIFFKSSSPKQAFNNMKEAISKLLIITEVFSESSASGQNSFNQCRQCFQMLTFDIGFSTSIYPVVLEVHENFDFQDEDESNIQDQTFKEFLFEDTFKFLLSNESSTSSFVEALQKIYGSAVSKDGTYHKEEEQCLSLEEINSMITFIKELKNLGQFELLFPSAAPKIQTLLRDLYHMVDPMRRLGSVLTVHWLLSSLLEQFQFMTKEAHTNFSEWRSKKNSRNSSQTIMKWLQPRGPKLNTVFEVRPHQGRVQGHDHFPTTAGHTVSDTGQDAIGLLGHLGTLPAHVQPAVDQHPQVLFRQAAFQPLFPKPVALHGVVVAQVRDPALGLCLFHFFPVLPCSIANYPLGLGLNKVIVLVTDDSQPNPQIVSSYKITIYREDRPSLPLFDDYVMCGFVQDCGSRIRPEESCGLQPLSREYLSAISQTVFKTCEAGDTKGQWIVPCLSCSDNRTCDWREITWQPHGCQYSVLAKPELQRCVEGRRILFIGDSTNRGMMYYLIERVNKTLQEWQKTHDVKCYHNINEGKTFISYSYYPQFWMNANQKPTFEKALEQLLQRSRPLENTDQTVLIVGGVQWLNSNHLQIIQKVLNRENLSNILVIIKSIGMGFHLPVDGIHSLSQAEVQNLWNENLVILDTAKKFGYEVVDTFVITMGRYKEFLQGKCGCHFHEVVKSNPSEESPHITMTLSRHYTLGKYFGSQSKPSQLQNYATNFQSPYHVRGPINQVYSEILLSRLCASKRELVST